MYFKHVFQIYKICFHVEAISRPRKLAEVENFIFVSNKSTNSIREMCNSKNVTGHCKLAYSFL